MKQELNVAPLVELLTVGIPAEILAEKLDDLAYDYARAVIELKRMEENNEEFLHDETSKYLFYLKELRDTLRKCCDEPSYI